MTTMESAFLTVLNRWATRTTVELLSAINCESACWTACWLFSSSADVASSKRIMRGFLKKTRAMARRCRCPPLRRLPRSPILVL
mmetsp:Transcript_35139/g.53913  ORF Transcript_35139/g.53913 Transcript_35139/m.53913 type:complete len:84 (-) Transcript_35139:815-1066(-)